MKKRLIWVLFILPVLVSACGHAQWTDEKDDQARLERKSTQRGWLGVSTQDMTRRLARSMDSKTERGALVNRVIEDSPAEAAGVKEEDIIVEFNSKPIDDADDLVNAVREEKPGVSVSLVVIRKDEKKTLQATLEKPPRQRSFSFSIPSAPRLPKHGHHGEGLGLTLMELGDQLGTYFEVPDGKGVLVKSVEPKSKAEKSGFKAGDVLLNIGKKPVERISDVRRALRKFDEGEKVECEISRKGKRMTLSVEVPELSSNDGYYFQFGPHSDYLEHFDIDINDEDWDETNQLKLERHQLNRDVDKLRKNLHEMKRTIRDNAIKLREELRSTLKEVIGS